MRRGLRIEATPAALPLGLFAGAGPVRFHPRRRAVRGATYRYDAAVSGPGRNEPCPCGSGKKYKRCCGAPSVRGPEAPSTDELHEMDRDLVGRILKTAGQQNPPGLAAAYASCPVREERDPSNAQIVPTYLAYHATIGGVSLLDLFLARNAQRLDPRELRWLEANRAAWLSIWEILEVEPGIALRLRDLLTGEERRVLERMGSVGVRPRHVFCVRVVDWEGISLMVGSHPRALEPAPADEAVRAVRKALGVRAQHVPVDRLRAECATVLRHWQSAVDASDEAQARRPLPTLQNTDGDPLELTEDRFDLAAGARATVEDRLEGVQGFQRVEPDPGDAKDETVFSVTKPGNAQHKSWDNTIVGRVVVTPKAVRSETNSKARADALRRRVEDACGGLLTHRDRRSTDAQDMLASSMGRAPSRARTSSGIPSEVGDRLVRDMKEKMYATWPDEAIPALDGLTPREAMKRPAGRRKLDLLLKEFELHEAGEPAERRADIAGLRQRLGLDEA